MAVYHTIPGTYGIIYARTGVLDKGMIECIMKNSIKDLDKLFPEKNISETEIIVNVPMNSDGKGYRFAYIYVSRWDVFNVLIGLNFDGTKRVEIFTQDEKITKSINRDYDLKDQIADELEKRMIGYNGGNDERAIDIQLFEKEITESLTKLYQKKIKTIRSSLNKITPDTYDAMVSAFKECLDSELYIAEFCKIIITTAENIPIYSTILSQACDKLAGEELFLLEEGEDLKFVQILNRVIKKHGESSKNKVEFMNFSIKLFNLGLLSSDIILDGLYRDTDPDLLCQTCKILKDTGHLIYKERTEKIIEISETVLTKLPHFEEMGNKRVCFALEDLREQLKNKFPRPTTKDISMDDKHVDRNWLTQPRKVNLEPIVFLPCIALPEAEEAGLRDYFNSFPHLQEAPLNPKGHLRAGMRCISSFINPLDRKGEKTGRHYDDRVHNILCTFKMPEWVCESDVYKLFARYSTCDLYPEISIDRRNAVCEVKYSPDPKHYQDASFAFQMCKVSVFKCKEGQVVLSFSFAKHVNRTQKQDTRALKPALNKGFRRKR